MKQQGYKNWLFQGVTCDDFGHPGAKPSKGTSSLMENPS